MNLSKCAGFCVRLKRFSGGKLRSSGANLKTSFGERCLATQGIAGVDSGAARVLDTQFEKGKLCEAEALKLLDGVEQNRSLGETVGFLDTIWKASAGAKFSVEFRNAYLRVCTENGVKIDRGSFLEIARAGADAETYRWLLKSACYDGNVGDVVEILGAMKEAGIPADESVFNVIVLGHVVNSGIDGARAVLQTMKAAKIPITENTHWSMLKGLCRRSDASEFLSFLGDTPLGFDEEHFYDVLYTLGIHGNHLWMRDFIEFVGRDSVPRQCTPNLENLCFRLVRRGKPEAAFSLFENFDLGGFGAELLEEMLLCKTPIETIIRVCKDMNNPRALEDLAELTLGRKLVDEACAVFSELETLRPHYFWPLFVRQGELFGEKGVLEVLEKMCEFGVRPDHETVGYLLGRCDLSDPDGLLRRLERFAALAMKDVFTPVVHRLLSEDRVDEAREFCAKRNLPIIGEPVLKQLSLSWKRTRKSEPVAYILQRICETNPSANDWTGSFLHESLKLCTSDDDREEVVRLIDLLKEKELKISSLYADQIYHTLKTKFGDCDHGKIESAVDKLLDVSKPDSLHIQHPKDMNLEELECHHTELRSKNMETRGVLRHMIQGYSRVNNHARVEELRELFKADGYQESAGMMASTLSSYVQGKNLAAARGVYEELRRSHPEFSLDSFKVIDYAELLVKAGEFAVAMDVLRNENPDIRKTAPIERNCWRLLNSARNPDDARKLFDVMVEKKYCKPTNIILGPLVRAYLKKDDLPGAVNMYINCVRDHRCTPLQVELLGAAIESKDDHLAGEILGATARIHGAAAAKFAFLAALAENGKEKPLQKLLMEMRRVNEKELRKRCSRWVKENKMVPLKTLLNSARRLSSNIVDLDLVRLSILKIYAAQNDCEEALHFWQQCSEDETEIPQELTRELLKLLDRCKFQIPDALKVYSR